MSSHHFVKEGQEPALFILDPLGFEVAAPLLEWAPLVLVSERAIEDVLLWSIKIDVVLAEEQNVNDLSNTLASQAPVTILSHARNESPLINALHFLIQKKQSAVNIFSTNANDTFSLAEKFAERIQINVMDGTLRWSAVASGHIEKWMVAGSILLLRDGVAQQTINSTNLKKFDGHYECLADGMVKLESKSFFWLGEPAVREN